jgi:hypothetical protein
MGVSESRLHDWAKPAQGSGRRSLLLRSASRPACLQKLVELTSNLERSLEATENKMSNKIVQTPYYKTIFLYETRRRLNLYETIRNLKYRLKNWIRQNKYRQHSFGKAFDWNWKETNYNRIALVNILVGKTPNCAYLEIGCASNYLFDSIPALNKVGIDPQNGGNIRKTSDEFFSTNKLFFDVVFIDGLHTYDQVRRDVINSIKFLKPGGWIALHDMLPRNWIEEHVPIVTSHYWTGDVWKVAFELSKTEGIDFKIIKIDNGVGVLKLTKNNPSLVNLITELHDKQFSYFYENVAKLPIVEWNDCQNWLRDN